MRTKQGHIGSASFPPLLVYGHSTLKDLLSFHEGDAPVDFYGGIVFRKLYQFLGAHHPHCRRFGAFVSFCKANGPVSVISFLSH